MSGTLVTASGLDTKRGFGGIFLDVGDCLAFVEPGTDTSKLDAGTQVQETETPEDAALFFTHVYDPENVRGWFSITTLNKDGSASAKSPAVPDHSKSPSVQARVASRTPIVTTPEPPTPTPDESEEKQ